MVIRNLFLFIIALIIIVSPAGAAQDYFIKAQVDQATVNLGDSLVYTVEVMTAGETQYSPDIILPSFGGDFQVGDIFTRSSVSILNGKTYIVNFKEVHLVVRKPGELSIPSSKVELIESGTKNRVVETSNIVQLLVKSTTGQKIVATPTQEIDVLRPIKKKANVTLNQWLPFGIAGFLIAAIIGVMVYLKYRPEPKEKGPEEPLDNRTPEQRAFDDLQEAIKLKEEGKINEYYSVLSVILRRFLSEQYEIRAQESTTKELVVEMTENRFKEKFMKRYEEYAVECDEIKFAGKMPLQDEVERAFPEVQAMIKEKHIQYPPPEPVLDETDGDGSGDDNQTQNSMVSKQEPIEETQIDQGK